MSIDLEQLFGEAGRHAPASRLDADVIVRRGRRLRARRRAAVGTTALFGAGAIALGSVTVAGQFPAGGPGGGPAGTSLGPASGGVPSPVPSASVSLPPAPPTPHATSSAPGPLPLRARLASVALPDPAPGFPVRRDVDQLTRMEGGASGAGYWAKTFLLAKVPDTVTTEADGSVSGVPNGPQVTVLVTGDPAPEVAADGTLEGRPVVATPTVAGVTGAVTSGAEKGVAVTRLWFSAGGLTVEVIGFGEVTPEQLVALGDALTGLR